MALVFSVCFFFSFSVEGSQTNRENPHGFKFGISRKDAFDLIEFSNLKVVSNHKYSNDLRKIVLSGSLSGVTLDPIPSHETRLEFYKDKLMSSSVLFSFEEPSRFLSAKSKLIGSLADVLGDRFDREKMFSYEVLSWDLLDTVVLATLNFKKKTIEIEYVHKPILEQKTAKDLRRKRREDPGDPAKQMFLDSNFSAQKKR
ncbi:MAG: hypothetical protein OXF23_03335 [Candidatus Dadabacteria bacterium]|nr:hypothetical protein [Candidatus Dadabacteria bacterium]MCY4262516.1 hypothetical protein [Candidatus Dadabacteria bacterium]